MRTAFLLGIVLISLAAAPSASALHCYEEPTPALAGAYADFDSAHLEAGPVAISCEYTLPP